MKNDAPRERTKAEPITERIHAAVIAHRAYERVRLRFEKAFHGERQQELLRRTTSRVPPGRPHRQVVTGLAGKLRCFCWLVEESGFEGATVRAVLTGLRMFGRFSYPTHVSTKMEDALAWMLPHLHEPDKWRSKVPAATSAIRQAREIRRIASSGDDNGRK